jgi:hypothetical protein
LLSTASALTMICALNFEVKVGCHRSKPWKKSKSLLLAKEATNGAPGTGCPVASWRRTG